MKLEDILTNRKNVAAKLDAKTLADIGRTVVADFDIDKSTRAEWETKTEKALKLALQVVESKSTPWEGCSNIKFPLLSIAALQFSSRVYPALIQGTEIVKMRVVGDDPGSEKADRAKRISAHMSYQVLEEDEAWESEMDKLLITLPIVGTAFKKTYFDPILGHNVSEHVMAKDLVVNYYAKSLETVQRFTHIVPMYRNSIEERIRRGIFEDIDIGTPQIHSDGLSEVKDAVQGSTAPAVDSATPHDVLEQHRYLDLDDDGYQEPYIVSVLRDTGKVLRIVPRFRIDDVEHDGKRVVCIKPRHHFTKYPFIPSPDGGFYDLGFGSLLGPINDSVDSLINQLVDAGTMANRGGGFLGRGARLRGGNLTFSMNQWHQVNIPGDDLRKAIVPMPIREPSQTLMALMQYLVEYGQRLSSTTDIMVGKTPGQNTPATTSVMAQEEGMKVFTAIYARIYRSMRQEFQKLYKLNQEYLNPESYYNILDSGEDAKIYQQDYLGDPTAVRPAADPKIASDQQKLAMADAVSQRAMNVPGYNKPVVERNLLKAMHVQNIDEVFPTGDKAIQPPPDPKGEVEKAKVTLKELELHQIHERETLQGQIAAALADADIELKHAQEIGIIAKAEAEEAGRQLEEYKAQVDSMNAAHELVTDRIDVLQAGEMNGQPESGTVSGMEGQPTD